MSSTVPTRDEPNFYLDGECRPEDLIDTLQRLRFENNKAVLQMDRDAALYLIDAVRQRMARSGK